MEAHVRTLAVDIATTHLYDGVTVVCVCVCVHVWCAAATQAARRNQGWEKHVGRTVCTGACVCVCVYVCVGVCERLHNARTNRFRRLRWSHRGKQSKYSRSTRHN